MSINRSNFDTKNIYLKKQTLKEAVCKLQGTSDAGVNSDLGRLEKSKERRLCLNGGPTQPAMGGKSIMGGKPQVQAQRLSNSQF